MISKTDRLPFGDDSVKEENLPRDAWVQEGMTVFTKPSKTDELGEKLAKGWGEIRKKCTNCRTSFSPNLGLTSLCGDCVNGL